MLGVSGERESERGRKRERAVLGYGGGNNFPGSRERSIEVRVSSA